jgi:isopenicillin N synthase-like dioxygenase
MRRSNNLMVSQIDLPRLPVIDLSLFDLGDPWRDQVGAQIDAALSRLGFFYVVGHGVDESVIDPLMAAARRFFAAEEAATSRVRHDYVPLPPGPTGSSCNLKEAPYLRTQVTHENPAAPSQSAARGPIRLPELPGFREPMVEYTRSLTGLAHKLMAMIARGLLLQDSYFVDRYTGSPATSFRICNYPRVTHPSAVRTTHGDSGASDPGLLTLLKQDGMSGGLEFSFGDRWVEAPDIPNSFVCSAGDALARLTNGRYLATSHRVNDSARAACLLMPFSFDPNADAVLEPIAAVRPSAPHDLGNDEATRRHLA